MPEIHFFERLTSFGNQSVILPFVAAIAITLWLGGARREAIVWSLAMVTALGATLLLKLFFLPCGHLFPGLNLESPSGHSAAAFAAYGGFAVVESRFRQMPWQRMTILVCGLLFAALIAGSRLVIHVHTLPEVLLGTLVGLAAPAILLWKMKTPTRSALGLPLLLVLLLPLALLIVLRGRTLPIEENIAGIAVWIARALGICA